MSKPEPSIDQWLKEAKADPKAAQCGMFLTHNGIVRITPKQQVREGVQGLGEVAKVQFSYDAEGVAAAEKEALTWPGVYYVRTWMNEGELRRCAAEARRQDQKRARRGKGNLRVELSCKRAQRCPGSKQTPGHRTNVMTSERGLASLHFQRGDAGF